MNFFERQGSGHISTEEIHQIAGTTAMVAEPMPKMKPLMDCDEMAPLVWSVIVEVASDLGMGVVPTYEQMGEQAKTLWLMALGAITEKYWDEQPIYIPREAELAFDCQNQLGGVFAISWKDAPRSLQVAYETAIFCITRLCSYESGDQVDTISEIELSKQWAFERFNRAES